MSFNKTKIDWPGLTHTQKDSDLQMRDKIIENMELTIKTYRKVLKEAGIPIDGFVEGD